jgi:hypothetical protein
VKKEPSLCFTAAVGDESDDPRCSAAPQPSAQNTTGLHLKPRSRALIKLSGVSASKIRRPALQFTESTAPPPPRLLFTVLPRPHQPTQRSSSRCSRRSSSKQASSIKVTPPLQPPHPLK